MKKLALMSVVCAGVAFTAVGCASEAGLNASGSAHTTSAPEPQTGVGVQGGVAAEAGNSTQTQPVQAAPEAPQTSPDTATVQ